MDKQKGFTLIEMLVVIAIIVILLGIIRPTLTTSSARTREFDCESRLKQVSMAMQAYVQDYEQFPPKLDAIDFILQDKNLLACPATDLSYYYKKPTANAAMDDVIISCINPQKPPKRLPHRAGSSYLTLTAGGHVKKIIAK